MTRLNYINRKSEGIKLGHIVAKDLRKRSKSCSSSTAHRENVPIELLLDKKSLTDEGLTEVARGLEDALFDPGDGTRGRLNALNLTGNGLTSRSLFEIAKTLRMSNEDLHELDLSFNKIRIHTDREVHDWSVFLDSLRRCASLKSLNLAGNDLGGSRAWQVFAKAFEDHFNENKTQLEYLSDEVNDIHTNESSIAGVMESLNIRIGDCSDGTTQTKLHLVRGLASITHIDISDVGLDDAGALWLSYCLGKHLWVQDRLHARQSLPPSHQVGHGIDYSTHKLSATGQKLLKFAETASCDPFDTTPAVPDNSPIATRTGSTDSVVRRRSSFTVQHHRKASSGSAGDHDHPSPLHLQGAREGMQSLQRKLQRTQLEDAGVHSVSIWSIALRMLTHVRRLIPMHDLPLSDGSRRENKMGVCPAEPSPTRPPRTPSPSCHEMYASKLVVDTAEVVGPAISVVGTPSIPITPQIFQHPRARHENFSYHSNSTSPQSAINGSARIAVLKAAIHMTDADEGMIGILPLHAWIRTLRHLCDPDEILSDRQVEKVIRYGRDRSTLATEAEALGKPRSVQIWRVLEALGCLSYED